MQNQTFPSLRRTGRGLVMITGLVLVLLALGGWIPLRPAAAAPAQVPDSSISDACLVCHSRPGLVMTLPSGEQLPITIDESHYRDSVHRLVECTQCHTTITEFPHPENTARDRRQISLTFYTSCQTCHVEQYNLTLDSVHQRAFAAGNSNAAICTDCHNPHTQIPLTDEAGNILPEARLAIPQTCAHCHSTIYDAYQQSVHGAALTDQANTDVPACIDCHGVHNIQDPTTQSFRNASPEICARCHTDAAIMDKYGISTDVLNTYVADFHGTTVTLFEKVSPDQPVNKPVCFDCHGIHNIVSTTDPVHGLLVKENLLAACQRCHPDASANFPDAWMSHYIPSPQNYPIVYFVNLFYKIFIPTVLGGMVVYVISDIVRRLINRWKGTGHS